MPDDPNTVPKSAILQSVTAEANGFYGVIVTVASAFLGGSLLFLEKFVPTRSGWPIVVMAAGWFALVAAIGCVARIRYMNLRSGKLALRGQYEKADKIDDHTDKLSNWSQWLLIIGMSALVVMGVLNFNQISKTEKKESMSDQKTVVVPLDKSIPYGSLAPSAPTPVQQAPIQQAPTNTPQPSSGDKK